MTPVQQGEVTGTAGVAGTGSAYTCPCWTLTVMSWQGQVPSVPAPALLPVPHLVDGWVQLPAVILSWWRRTSSTKLLPTSAYRPPHAPRLLGAKSAGTPHWPPPAPPAEAATPRISSPSRILEKPRLSLRLPRAVSSTSHRRPGRPLWNRWSFWNMAVKLTDGPFLVIKWRIHSYFVLWPSWCVYGCSHIQMSSRDIEPELTPLQTSPCPLPEVAQLRREPPTIGMDYLSVPPALGWGRTRASAHSPLFRFAHNFLFHDVNYALNTA